MPSRRLAAIMFTDIAGYTTLMGKDEDKAFDMLSRNRSIHQSFIDKYQGTLIKEMGDGILASFSLASEAVRCSMDIQKACIEQNIPLRIGIHEGEMVFSGSDVVGDGVNIASRLQEEAQEGCIMISGKVFSEVKNRIDITITFIGEKTLKNVDEPVKLYQVHCEDQSTASNHQSTFALLDHQIERKSIVVLPFADISPNQDNEYFSDGLTEEIISDLSQIDDLRVISRTSSNLFKGTKKSIIEIARELNVQYVLEGSVRKAGNNLRITAQLIDAPDDAHLWAEKYNGSLEDIFDIQEKVSRSIVDALQLKISSRANEKITEHPIDNVKVYEIHLRARFEMMQLSEDALDHAIRLITNGISIIGENEMLYADLGYAYLWYYIFISKKDKSYIKKAEDCINKIFSLNSGSSIGYFLQGHYYLRTGNVPKASISFRKSLEIDPNQPDSLGMLGWFYTLVGKKNEAKSLLTRLLEIDPLTSINHLYKGISELVEGRFDTALEYVIKARELEPEYPLYIYWNAIICAYENKYNEAYDLFEYILEQKESGIFGRLSAFFKYALKGEKEEALKTVTDELKSLAKEDEIFPIWMAECYSLIEENAEALDWLEHGTDYGFLHYDWLSRYDPFLKNIREESRFKKLLERVNKECENFEVEF